MRLSITSALTRLNENKAYKTVFLLLFASALVALFFDTFENAHDFTVMWKAAGHFLGGETIYSIERDGGMIFKYPPWWVFPFVPFALFPISVAKGLWATVCVGSLVSIYRSLIRMGFSFFSVSFSFVFFWGIWAIHFIDGQVEVPVLALFLLMIENLRKSPDFFRNQLALLMSIKVFSVVSVFSVLDRKNFFRTALSSLMVAGVLSLSVSLQTKDNTAIFSKWVSATQSGDLLLGKTIGRDNQGIPAAIRRVGQSVLGEALNEKTVMLVVLFFGVSLFAVLFRDLDPMASAFFWLAGAVILHPLAWFHFFVWVFPLSVWILDSVFKKKANALWILFPVLVGAVTESTLGRAGALLEVYSFKSIVTLFGLVFFSIRKTGSIRPVYS